MSIERIFYPAATMAAGSVSYLGGVKELQFRVMNLMRISLKRTRFWCCACARRWILARAGLDFGTEARAQAAGPPRFTLPRDAGNTPSLAASLSARVRGIPASCATNGAGTASVFGRPLVQIALAALEPLVSSRSCSARRAPAPGALHMVRYELPVLAPRF